ncbi:MAG TPA: hypothetical protein VI385_15585 [Flavisolibacter sp.]
MKKQSFNTLVKRSVLSLGLSTILLAGAASAQSSTNPDPAVKYIGTLDGQPMFKVQLNNQTGDVYHLTIKDDEGTVLYTERITDKQFAKSFKFDNAERNNVKLTFVLEGNKTVQSKEFNVNSSTQVLDNVVVTTL